MGVSFTLSPLNEVTELIKVTPLGSLPPQLARRVSVSGLTFVSPRDLLAPLNPSARALSTPSPLMSSLSSDCFNEGFLAAHVTGSGNAASSEHLQRLPLCSSQWVPISSRHREAPRRILLPPPTPTCPTPRLWDLNSNGHFSALFVFSSTS